jgi:hypothetical protein
LKNIELIRRKLMALNTDKLNQPRKPGPTAPNCTQSGPEASSLSVSHPLQLALKEQRDHAAGIQEAAIAAIDRVAHQNAGFLAAAMSGQLMWGRTAQLLQEQLEALPKSIAEVALDLEPLPALSWQPSKATLNPSSGSSVDCKAE